MKEQLELDSVLKRLVAEWENEVVEFKQADQNYSTDKIGQYFSALSNEANLRGASSGWLVFGVANDTRRVTGTDYRPEPERLQSLKHQIAQSAEPSITFPDIHTLHHKEGRVLLFEIPAAPQGIPIAWKGHYYARAGESLVPLGLDKQDAIRSQAHGHDWTGRVVEGATLDDLDETALTKARQSFAQKYANRFAPGEVEGWPLATFLDRARVTRAGAITRTALLLLGKPESAWRLSPHPAELTWKLEGPERAYVHFGPPFLLTTTQLYQRIRNIQLRILPDDELLPVEVAKYEQAIVLEALHNCIAHQDYTRNARIIVTEQPDRLVFENEGDFFEGQPEDYVSGQKTPRRYRNPALAQAMVELNMIDTMGYGIHEMYSRQVGRYLPLPDYDLNEPGAVSMTIHGSVADPAYSRLLIEQTDLSLTDVLALDRVQKGLRIPANALKRLRRRKLVEGRKPNLHIAAAIAEASAKQTAYIRTRAQDDAFYAKLITDYLSQFQPASRQEIDALLMDKLSEGLTDKQKRSKVGNLLSKLRGKGVIHNAGSRGHPAWQLTEGKPDMDVTL